jgi:hypothetical protein
MRPPAVVQKNLRKRSRQVQRTFFGVPKKLHQKDGKILHLAFFISTYFQPLPIL